MNSLEGTARLVPITRQRRILLEEHSGEGNVQAVDGVEGNFIMKGLTNARLGGSDLVEVITLGF